jgi:hypothetical protein
LVAGRSGIENVRNDVAQCRMISERAEFRLAK